MVIAFLTSFMPLIVANITSVTQTGLTVFSVPFIPYDVFQENYRQVMGTISDLNMFRLFIVLLSYFIKPVNIAAITLAYMNRLSLYNNQALITEIVN